MKISKIMVPVDGSKCSMKAAEYALSMAVQLGCSMVLVHCHRPFPKVMGEPHLQIAVERINEKSMEIIEPYLSLVKARGVSSEYRIVEGSPGEAVADLAAEEKCDMIIMGCRGFGGMKSFVLGSVAHKVLHLSPCPVLVIR